MTVELTMLAYSAALLLVLILLQAMVGIGQYGVVPLAGPRDDLGPPKPLTARAKRIVDNHREGLTVFAPLVLIAAVAGIHTAKTVLGAELFFYSRLAHAIIYLTGLPLVRPLAWAVGLAGTLLILASVLGLR
jgi:uncharacterized MAPEG superfamily protein